MNRLFTPVSIGGMTLKNRIVMAPTSMMLPVEEKISFLGRVADGGAALIYIGDMGVEPAFSPGGINLLTEEGLEGCRRVIERLHRGGAKAGAQLYLWDYDLPRLRRMAEAGASREEIRREKNKDPNAYIGSLSEARIEAIIRSFAQAAQTARQVGFDLVQLLGGNLLNSFSSGYINRRTDTFGGSVEKRTALPCAVVRAVRQAVGRDFPVEYKLAVHDDAIPCGQGGPDVGEIGVFVRALEQAGVDAFMVALSNRADINDTVPPTQPSDIQGGGLFFVCIRRGQTAHHPAGVLRRQNCLPRLRPDTDRHRTPRLYRDVPPAGSRSILGTKGRQRQGGHHPALPLLQRRMPQEPARRPALPLRAGPTAARNPILPPSIDLPIDSMLIKSRTSRRSGFLLPALPGAPIPSPPTKKPGQGVPCPG